MKVDNLLEKEPFKHSKEEKEQFFVQAMRESLNWHYNNGIMFKKFVDSQNFLISEDNKLENYPQLPVTVFKELELVTGSKENIRGVIKSSATTSGKPSSIPLDLITMKRQQTALRKIMESFIGKERRVFIIFDSSATIKKEGLNISSRASAIRGMMPFAKSMKFILNNNLEFDQKLFEEAIESVRPDEEVCIFGFTWLIYKTFQSIKSNGENYSLFNTRMKSLKEDKKILHIGGWKKLKDISINKQQFNQEISSFLNTTNSNVIDFYGMTEQLGTVYPDCEYGYKHLPLYSEIIIRDVNTFEPLGIGESGFIQLLTPIPNSYPGISILTEDIGEIQGVDDCLCGRKGKYFIFKKRIETAPLKGCGDTL